MTDRLSSTISTSGAGYIFEYQVGAYFLALMLTDGYVPFIPNYHIQKIGLQSSSSGYQTDDIFLETKNNHGNIRKMLIQVKLRVSFTKKSKQLKNALKGAWLDYNSGLFDKEKDFIVLVTGPLNIVDQKAVLWFINWAKMNDQEKFYSDIQLFNFTPNQTLKKLEIFRYHLNSANQGICVTDKQLYNFLKSFHIISFDFESENGLSHSLMYTLLSNYSNHDPLSLWAELVQEIEYKSMSASKFDLEMVNSSVVSKFNNLKIEKKLITNLNVLTDKEMKVLITASLVGEWDENYDDNKIIEILTRLEYSEFKTSLQHINIKNKDAISHFDGKWKVTDKFTIIKSYSDLLNDEIINHFIELSEEVLEINDSKYNLNSDEDNMFNSLYSTVKYSESMRSSISSTLAYIKFNNSKFKFCTTGLVEKQVNGLISKLFKEDSWEWWATIKNQLPYLSETAPVPFLQALDRIISDNSQIIRSLFKENRNVLFRQNNIIGILRSLERLAWSKEFFQLSVISLSKLSILETEILGNNQIVEETIVRILFPGFPNTLALIKERVEALKNIYTLDDKLGWKINKMLIVDFSNVVIFPTDKPEWITYVPNDITLDVSYSTIYSEYESYFDLALEKSKNDFDRLSLLTAKIDKIPPFLIEKLLENIDNYDYSDATDEKMFKVWGKLNDIRMRHVYYSDKDWSLNKEIIRKIENISKKVEPQSDMYKYQHLFDYHAYRYFLDAYDDYESADLMLNKERVRVLEELYYSEGLDSILNMSKMIEDKSSFGVSLASVRDIDMFNTIISRHLCNDISFDDQILRRYIYLSYVNSGYTLLDFRFDKEQMKDIAQLLSYLPFERKVWKDVRELLKEDEYMYWELVDIGAHDIKCLEDLLFIKEKLMSISRILPIINAFSIYVEKNGNAPKEEIISLLNKFDPRIEKISGMDSYYIKSLIKYLSGFKNVTIEEIVVVEWKYFSLLSDEGKVDNLKIFKLLAADYSFFIEIIKILYKPRKKKLKDDRKEINENMAKNAWRLLHNWKMVPGYCGDTLNIENLTSWLDGVKKNSKESDRFEVSMQHVGSVFAYAPTSMDLWIDKRIAKIINDEEHILKGYITELFNKRGIHSIDSTGSQELQLSRLYRDMAQSIENFGLLNLYGELIELSNNYIISAEKIKNDPDL